LCVAGGGAVFWLWKLLAPPLTYGAMQERHDCLL
jgi:hypothetical protein